jgi:hypothetical protein
MVAVTDVTPLPEAVMVMVWPLTTVALPEAFRLMLPEVPAPGWVMVAVTPLGRVLMAMLEALLMVKVRAFETSPVGEIFVTVTEALPTLAMSPAGRRRRARYCSRRWW